MHSKESLTTAVTLLEELITLINSLELYGLAKESGFELEFIDEAYKILKYLSCEDIISETSVNMSIEKAFHGSGSYFSEQGKKMLVSQVFRLFKAE